MSLNKCWYVGVECPVEEKETEAPSLNIMTWGTRTREGEPYPETPERESPKLDKNAMERNYKEIQDLLDGIDVNKDYGDNFFRGVGTELKEYSPICINPKEKWGEFRSKKLMQTNTFDTTKYTTLKTLGKGSYGTVTLSKYKGSLVAIKNMELKEKVVNSKYIVEIQASIISELTIRNLDHPNIAGICDAGFVYAGYQPTSFSMVMDVGNMTLSDYILTSRVEADFHNRTQMFTPTTTAFLIYQLFKGIEAQHIQFVTNNDLKPSNCLINGIQIPNRLIPEKKSIHGYTVMPHLQIIDFGLSRSFCTKPVINKYKFSLWWRPIEAFLGRHDITYPGDVWAAGTMAFEIACGNTMFSGGDNDEMFNDICNMFGPPTEQLLLTLAPYNRFMVHKKVYMTPPRAEVMRKRFEMLYPGLFNLIENMTKYDPNERITIFEALKHPFFINNGAVEIWNFLFGSLESVQKIQTIRPKFIDNYNTVVSPEWLLPIFHERSQNEFFRLRKIYKDNRIVIDKNKFGNTNIEIFKTGARLMISLSTTFFASQIMHRFSMISPQTINAMTIIDIVILTYACIRLAQKYRNEEAHSLSTYIDFAKKERGINIDPEVIVNTQIKIITALDFDFFVPSIYDFLEPMAFTYKISQLSKEFGLASLIISLFALNKDALEITSDTIAIMSLAYAAGKELIMDRIKNVSILPEKYILSDDNKSIFTTLLSNRELCQMMNAYTIKDPDIFITIARAMIENNIE